MKAVPPRWLIFIVVAIFAGITARAQQYLFSRYPIEAGLSQSVVNCLYQDNQGYIWAGTQNGLNRFDGYSFQVFTSKTSDTNAISNNWIYSVDADAEGNLWIGTKGGLNQYLRGEKRFRTLVWSSGYTRDISRQVYDARVSESGRILINTPPVLTIYDPVKGTFRNFTSPLAYDGAVKDNRIPLLEDREGLVWMGSTRGLACFDPRSESFTCYYHDPANPNSLAGNEITALYEADDGTIWIGTTNGLSRYDKKSGLMTQARHDSRDPRSLSSSMIRAITGDRQGKYWIGTEGGGLNRVSVSRDGKLSAERFSNEQHGIGHNIVLSLMTDRSENLWIGTLQGLAKTDLKKRKFKLYRTTDTPTPVNLLGNVIASVYKDRQGLLWVGNWGQGLNIVNRSTGQVVHYASNLPGKYHLPNDYVHVIFPDARQNIWIGTRDGIFVFDRNSGSFTGLRNFFQNNSLPDFSGVRIYSIIRARDDSYWIATQNGLFSIRIREGKPDHFTAESRGSRRISGNLVYALLEDRDGLIWIATLGGVDVYNPATRRMKHFRNDPANPNSLCDNFVTSLREDHNGDIWIGTNSYVNRYSKRDGRFTCYGQETGFPSNLVYEIVKDDRQNLWFATGNGLCRYDTATGKFRTYSVEEGLQSKEFNLHASYKSSDGEVFFGGMNGLNAFYPDSLSDNPYMPQVVLTSCYKTTGGEQVNLDVENVNEVVFNFNDHTFTIEFAALEFTYPEKNRYAYRLEGVSGDWIETGTRRFVPFSNLPPGEYTFRVKGSNNDGLWNEEGPSLKIIIKPPWWRSGWAWTAYLVLAAGAVLLYIRLRELKLVRERDLLEEKVHLRTLQIEKQNAEILGKNEELSNLNKELTSLNTTKDKFFSIIAHDLRNPFNTILGLSEMTLGNIAKPEPEKMRKTVSDIRDTSKHAYDLLQNLLIWARSQTNSLDFQPVQFDLPERIRDNIDLVRSQAGKKNITVTYTGDGPVMATGDTRMIDTVLRNLLTNAIKFTPQQGSVTVTASENENHFEVTVADTGIGIAPDNIPKLFQLDSKFTRKGTDQERGSGLGLLLCNEFISRHGGTIRVTSEPGKGSRFSFSLPKTR